MRILLTNDDGIYAPGLAVLERIASQFSSDIWVVAPQSDQSGIGRALTLSGPVRIQPLAEKRWALAGTPSDCVLMAIQQIMNDTPPDLILSGVNRGQNLGEDTSASGTIAAAFLGAHFGIKSIAFSQTGGFRSKGDIQWDTAEHYAPELIKALLKKDWPEKSIFNINFPDRTIDEVEGVEMTFQGRRDSNIIVTEKRTDLRRRDYYLTGFNGQLSDPPDGSDLRAIYDGRISITPLHLDLTDHLYLKRLKLAPICL